jgi:hypothetical protein
MQRPASAIFDRFTGRAKPALVHPTAKKFDAEALMRSLDPDAITGPDLELLAAAVFFGGQIQTLRQHVLSTVFSQMGQRDVLRLAIAAANRAVILTKAAMYAEAKKRARTAEAGHLAAVAEATVSTQQGAMAANAVSTAAIDALPHWFALAADRPETPCAIFGSNVFGRAGPLIPSD